MTNPEYYEPRHYDLEYKLDNDVIPFESNEEISLKEYTFLNDYIVILGNPGIGKSIELSHLFNELWSAKEETEIIPIGINIKNFRQTDTFENIIPYAEWKNLNRLVFILDGLDEISNIQDFVSTLSTFISKYENLDLKFVLSCRTNTYNKYVINLPNFKKLHLKNLTIKQSLSILSNKYGINLNEVDILPVKTLLSTPFFVDLFAEYYSKENTITSNYAEIWDYCIDLGIVQHINHKKKQSILNKPEIRRSLSKFALVNELMQNNSSSDEETLKITESDYTNFIEYPFIRETNENPLEYGFTHKQYQEYFVSKILLQKDFNEILDIIRIDQLTNNIHPSLANTVTFLLNLSKKSSPFYDQLIDWLIINNRELLFQADSDRIASFQNKVFQDFFISECVNTTLWINNSGINFSDYVRFGDSIDNFNFLLNYITDSNCHFRIRISALSILEDFKSIDRKLIQKEFMTILKNELEPLNIKSEIIDILQSLKTQQDNPKLIPEIIELFKDETDAAINRKILYLVKNSSQIDESFDFINREFDYAFNIKPRENEEKVTVIHGNDYIITSILLKIDDPNNFIKLSTKLLLRNHSDLRKNFPEKFILRIKKLSANDQNIPIRLIENIIQDKTQLHSFDSRDFLSRMVIDLKLEQITFQHFFKEEYFERLQWFLAKISTTETISFFIQNWQNILSTKQHQIEGFRNIINSYHGYELAGYLQDELEKQRFYFKTRILSPDEINKQRLTIEQNQQEEFNLIFYPEQFKQFIERSFKEYQIEQIDRTTLHQIEDNLYKKNDNYFWNRLPLATRFINFALRYSEVLSIVEIKSIIETKSKFIFFADREIKYISSHQKSTIFHSKEKTIFCNWLSHLSKDIDFNNLIDYKNANSFYVKSEQNFESLNLILKYFCDKDFDIQLEQDFLLNSLEFIQLDNFNENSEGFKILLDNINNKELVDQYIIQKFEQPYLVSSVYSRMALYALNNNLREVFPTIRQKLLSDNSIFEENILLKTFISIEGEDLLIDMIENIENRSCWTAIKLLMKKNPTQYYEISNTKAKELLSSKTNEFKSDALRVLLTQNDPFVIEFLCNTSTNNLIYIGSSSKLIYVNYSAQPDNVSEKVNILFQKIYLTEENQEPFKTSYLNDFFTTYLQNLSRTNYFQELFSTLEEIKNKLPKTEDHGLFYINLIINNCKKSYISHKSKPLTFKEALKKTTEIIS